MKFIKTEIEYLNENLLSKDNIYHKYDDFTSGKSNIYY